MKRSTLVTLTVIAVLVAGAVTWFIIDRQPATNVTGPVAMDTPLPSIVGQTLDGKAFNSADFRGRPTVINTWATWCGPCESEQPALVSLAEKYGSRVRFVGINYRDDIVQARRWVTTQFHVPYPSLSDPAGRTAHLLKYPLGLPDTFVVDGSGVIRWAFYTRVDPKALAGVIDQVLAAQASGSPSP